MVLTREQKMAFADLKCNKGKLTAQQYRTVKGQILSGDTAGALKGLQKLLTPGKQMGRSRAYAKKT